MSTKPETDTHEDDAMSSDAEGTETSSNNEDGATQSGGGEDELGDAGKKALEKERDARKAAEKRAKDIERELKALKAAKAKDEDAELGELERTAKERDKWQADFAALEGSLKRERMTSHAISAATKLGAIEPSAVAGLISLDDIEWDDERNPVNAEELVANVKKAYPRLFSKAPGNGNGGNRDARPVNAASTPTERMRNAYASKR